MSEIAGKPPIDHAFAGERRGGAADPTYAGALSFMRRPYGKAVAGCDLVIWGVPFDLSVTNRPGTRFGPQAIRRASAIFDGDPQYPSRIDPFARLAAMDYGDCALPRGDLPGSARAIEAEAAGILATGAHLVTLGGDHFVTLPLLRAHVARHGKLALIQFDAHQDTWDDGPGGIGHGSFVLEAVREGLIDVARSIQVGIRTVAPRDCGLAVIDGYEAQALGVDAVAERVRAHVGDGPAYLTFDIDALDPAFAPGTGTPVSGGFTADQALRLVWGLRALDIRGMDVVEVSPPYDHADITAIAASTIVQHHIQALALKKGG
ncbi:agmatinase [Bosea minatitlanensis]|uniref:Agmatinase n=1 Tax=Bosea minatitlanensis TaxID=128782 RepID=A0ABW0FCS6_9HYPH|nr:agmatinase [Bosea minatitlanensis]MCT4495675.1 agmatinase [Bosea minatitlanensis]